jgi:hypothetical protein
MGLLITRETAFFYVTFRQATQITKQFKCGWKSEDVNPIGRKSGKTLNISLKINDELSKTFAKSAAGLWREVLMKRLWKQLWMCAVFNKSVYSYKSSLIKAKRRSHFYRFGQTRERTSVLTKKTKYIYRCNE